MTLKTFHFAGVASMNVTLGVPRIKEIINASKVISTPIIDAALLDNFSNDHDKALLSANIVKGRIQKTYLEDVIKSMNIIMSAGECYLRIKIDVEIIRFSQLEISLDSIKSSIVKAPKLKLSENVCFYSTLVLIFRTYGQIIQTQSVSKSHHLVKQVKMELCSKHSIICKEFCPKL